MKYKVYFEGVIEADSAAEAAAKAIPMLKATPIPKVDASEEVLHIYVDGSHKEGVGTAWGFLALEKDKEVHRDRGMLAEPGAAWNVSAEIAAALAALDWAYHCGYKEAVIYHDYTGIAAWIVPQSNGRPWKTNSPVAVDYVAKVRSYQKTMRIGFVHVKGHSGNTYNDMVDEYVSELTGRGR